MTVAEYAEVLAAVPSSYADLPFEEIRTVNIGETVIMVHPSSHPIVWRRDQGWQRLEIRALPQA